MAGEGQERATETGVVRASGTKVVGRADEYGEVGTRVATVLNAAEDAAEQIRADATRAAEDIRRRAENEARAYATRRRQEAEEEAHRVIAEAQAQAHAIRQAAHAEARGIEEAAVREQERFRAQTVALEKRVEHALDGLRGVTAELQDVVLDAVPGSGPAAPAEPQVAAAPDETPRPAEPAERPRRRIPLGFSARRAKGAEDERAPATAFAPGDEEQRPPIYDALRQSVQKVGDRWVAKEGDPSEPEGDGLSSGDLAADDPASREDLYERAKRLDIRGRGKMSKQELAAAVAAAEAARPHSP